MKYTWRGYRWPFAAAFLGTVAGWLAVELYGALWRPGPGDTFTELIRPLVHAHPVLWWGSLGAFAGFVCWFTLHIWWGKK